MLTDCTVHSKNWQLLRVTGAPRGCWTIIIRPAPPTKCELDWSWPEPGEAWTCTVMELRRKVVPENCTADPALDGATRTPAPPQRSTGKTPEENSVLLRARAVGGCP